MKPRPEQCADLLQATIIMSVVLGLYAIVVPRLPGGIGFCRKSRVVVYFKSPSPLGCPGFINGMDEMELPPGASADKAVNICSEIMKAKHDYMRAKLA